MKLSARLQHEPTTTITVGIKTAETVRKLVGEMQLRSGITVTQRMVIDAALDAYIERLKEEKK